MRKIISLIAVLLFVVGCGEDPQPTCSEWVDALYGVQNCALYNIEMAPPERISQADAFMWCRDIAAFAHTDCPTCVDELNAWLNCTPDACVWNEEMQMFLATDCNDEFDRLLVCQC